jgi:hypothetical protein
MELAAVASIAAGGIASLAMSWQEGRRLRSSKKQDDVADDAAEVVAEEAVEAISGAREEHELAPPPPAASSTTRPKENRAPGHPSMPPEVQFPLVPPGDMEQLVAVVEGRLLNGQRFRDALTPKKKALATWVMQGVVSAALLGVSVFAFATNTEPGVGFAFCGSLGGFWMREITA